MSITELNNLSSFAVPLQYSGSSKGSNKKARAAIARGQVLFNSKPIQITGVKGMLDIGVSDASRRTPDMPLYTLQNKVTGETIETTDPGRALVTGKWKDIGRFKGPVLRSVASRPPYFHNGSAKDLPAVIEFYNTRFSIGLTDREQADLVAFLASL